MNFEDHECICPHCGMAADEEIQKAVQEGRLDLTPERHQYEGEPEYWVVGADLRACFGMPESNDAVAGLIKEKLAEKLPGLAQRINFDPEMSCLFAYAKSKEDADDLVAFIIGLVAQGIKVS